MNWAVFFNSLMRFSSARTRTWARPRAAAMIAGLLVLSMVILRPCSTWAQPQQDVPADRDAQRVQWLRDNAMTIRTIDPTDKDFTDLMPLVQFIGDAHIVALGEQSHGDGATFHAKTRLIKFLHEVMGFDVLVWESGMYDCYLVEQALRAGKPMNEAWRKGIFPIWAVSDQVQPLFDFIQETRLSPRPIEIAGMDSRFTGRHTAATLLEHLVDVLDRAGYQPEYEEPMAAIDNVIRKLKTPPANITDEDRQAVAQSIATFVRVLEEPGGLLSKVVSRRERSLLARALGNLDATVEMMYWFGRIRRGQSPRADRVNALRAREPAMADTLIWLARQRYPDRKLIVWGASSHLLHGSRTIELQQQDGTWKLDDDHDQAAARQPMGNAVHAAVGESIYTIGFIAYGGEIGSAFRRPRSLPDASNGTLEELCHRTGVPAMFIDLREMPDLSGGQWLRQRLIARPKRYAPMRADWSRVCDALLFIDRMYPSTRIAVETEPDLE